MAYLNVKFDVNSVCVASKDLSSTYATIEKRDEVVITGVCGLRGYSLLHKETGIEVTECGFDCVVAKKKENK